MLITPSSGSRPSILRVCLTVKDYNNNQQQYVQKNNMQKEEEEKTLEGKINEKIKEKGKIDQLFIIKAVGNKDKDIPVPRSKINIITTLTTLTVLSLRKCNLTTLPKNITSLVNLKYLNLSGNKFHNWPIFITKLVNLETLLLDNNQLEVPPEFQLATLTKLQILNLSNNQLKYMPVEIATLKNLRELYLDGNLLEDIPKQILFLEDLDEYLYHVDRMAFNLFRNQKFKNIKGLIVGGMTKMNDNNIPFGNNANEFIFRRFIKERFFGKEFIE